MWQETMEICIQHLSITASRSMPCCSHQELPRPKYETRIKYSHFSKSIWNKSQISNRCLRIGVSLQLICACEVCHRLRETHDPTLASTLKKMRAVCKKTWPFLRVKLAAKITELVQRASIQTSSSNESSTQRTSETPIAISRGWPQREREPCARVSKRARVGAKIIEVQLAKIAMRASLLLIKEFTTIKMTKVKVSHNIER